MASLHTKDILNAHSASKRLVQDNEYYRYIFKKTEKVVSVVFYILHNTATDTRTEGHIADIQHAARQVHDAAIQSLETRMHAAEDAVREVAISLVALESKIRVARAASIIAEDVVNLIAAEIDTILRGLNRYISPEESGALPFDMSDNEPAPLAPADEKPRRERAPQQRAERQQSGSSDTDRRSRIKTVLAARGTASIKDIAAVVTECSEKTIQRELNAMIEDNEVARHGERRWSVYSLADSAGSNM